MKRRLPRTSPLRILAILMMIIPLVLGLEFGIIKMLQRRQEKESTQEGLYIIQMLLISVIQYAEEHDQNLPSADHWEQELRPYLGSSVSSYQLKPVLGREPTRIVMNREVSGLKRDRMDGNVILFFETAAKDKEVSKTLDALPNEKQMENSLIGWGVGHLYSKPTSFREYHIQESRKGMRYETAKR